jgi:hypothetical protein
MRGALETALRAASTASQLLRGDVRIHPVGQEPAVVCLTAGAGYPGKIADLTEEAGPRPSHRVPKQHEVRGVRAGELTEGVSVTPLAASYLAEREREGWAVGVN